MLFLVEHIVLVTRICSILCQNRPFYSSTDAKVFSISDVNTLKDTWHIGRQMNRLFRQNSTGSLNLHYYFQTQIQLPESSIDEYIYCPFIVFNERLYSNTCIYFHEHYLYKYFPFVCVLSYLSCKAAFCFTNPNYRLMRMASPQITPYYRGYTV
jgi:hypothetical protein